MRWWCPALVVLSLTACGTSPKKPAAAGAATPSAVIASPKSGSAQSVVNPCAPTRVHRDSDYTAGGLYAPGVSDSGPAVPIDVSGVKEPVPRDEPRSRYGNRSPYMVLGKSYRVLDSAAGYHERGIASWYGAKFNGRATSSGELYDMCQFSAAHKTLPLPSFVRVTNLSNGRSLIVRVNDRGPFHSDRIMDLSYAAAVRLGVDKMGTARVELQAVTADGVQTAAVPQERFQPIPVESGEKIVQVGSFGERANARKLVKRLQDADIDDIALDRAEVSGRDVWRVQIGPVAPDKLLALMEQLRQLGLPNPRVFSQ